MEMIVSFFLGALSSWIISYYYYKKSRLDTRLEAAAARIAQRLDSFDSMKKVFLVALFQHEGPIPLYSQPLNWSGRRIGDEHDYSCASGGITMWQFFRHHELVVTNHPKQSLPPHMITFTLNERGRECATYLKDREIADARFDIVGTDDAEKLFHAYGFPPRRTQT